MASVTRRKSAKRVKTLRPIHVSPAIRAAYRRAIEDAVKAMHRRVFGKLMTEYEILAPRMARDEVKKPLHWRTPAERFADLLDEEREVWDDYFDRLGARAAGRFGRSVRAHVTRCRRRALQDMFGSPFEIRINPSRYTNDIFQAITEENVGLIRTIPEQYFSRIRHDVTDCIASGLDRAEFARRLRDDYGKSARRAAIIARDQTAKATEAMSRTTDADLGITEGIWMHVPGRQESRPSHVKMDGKRFVIAEGLYDPAVRRKVKCAELPLCQCTYMPIVPDSWMP